MEKGGKADTKARANVTLTAIWLGLKRRSAFFSTAFLCTNALFVVDILLRQVCARDWLYAQGF